MSSLASLWALASRAQISCRPGGGLLLSLPAGLSACLHPPSFIFLVAEGRVCSCSCGQHVSRLHLGRWSHESRVARDKGACAGLGLALPTLTPKERGLEERPRRVAMVGLEGRRESMFLFRVGSPSSDLHFQ